MNQPPPATNSVTCPNCGKSFKSQGLHSHMRSARCTGFVAQRAAALGVMTADSHEQDENALLMALGYIDRPSSSDRPGSSQATQPELTAMGHHFDGNTTNETNLGQAPASDVGEQNEDNSASSDFGPAPVSPEPQDDDDAHELKADDMKVQTHPHSLKATQVVSFVEYCASINDFESDDLSAFAESIDQRPWRPFRTRLDFEVAEVMLESHMGEELRKRTIACMVQAKGVATASDFTVQSHQEMEKIWGHARDTRASSFIEKQIDVDYKKGEFEYRIWYLPLWQWCQELLSDPHLISKFTWDAQRVYKYNGHVFERIYHEPWTGDAWWAYQDTLPASAKPFCIIIWADKTRLSSFGTEKGYPMLARCANLPISIRNGEGVGGARLVGWLPIPPELASETSKRGYVDHKRDVWHQAVAQIVESIKMFTEVGTSLECADGVVRHIYPHILILSGDFEEQSSMALTRGVKALFPCPVCLVPKAEQANLSQEYQLRTTRGMESIWQAGQDLNATEREKSLRSVGLRNVHNVFWELHNTDVYSALSWDRLHAYHGGLFEYHLLGELKNRVLPKLANSRRAETQIDAGLDSIPRWSGLYHFSRLGSTGEFADGAKFEDLSKVIIIASQHVLSSDESPAGFALLKLIRVYLELDMFASLTVQTESTIEIGREELRKFQRALEEYEKFYPEKNWAFPKAHTHLHIFEDIINKGVTRNYNTKPNEKLNGPLKSIYQDHTNFKDVAPQILRISENEVVSTIIRTGIDRLDEVNAILKAAAEDEKEDSAGTDPAGRGQGAADPESGHPNEPASTASSAADEPQFEYVTFGSQLPATTVKELAVALELTTLRKKINRFLCKRLGGQQIVPDNHPVVPYRLIKIHYDSVVDWRWNVDILRSNPTFHGQPRYDYALLKVGTLPNQAIFVQLLGMFKLFHRELEYNLALVLPMDMPLDGGRVMRDRDSSLRLTRVKPRRRSNAVVIDTRSLIRGGLLAEDHASASGELLVVDCIDQDTWLRMKTVDLSMYNVDL